MDNNLTLIIIGLYTLIYVIVIQKSQIDKQKDVISSMKSFMEIFNVDEVKKHVEMRNERVMEDAAKLIIDNKKFKDMSEHLVNTTTEPIQEFYKKNN